MISYKLVHQVRVHAERFTRPSGASRWTQRSGYPIATAMLETAPNSPLLTEAGVRVLDHWIPIIAPVFVRSGLSVHDAKLKSQLLITSMEGALLLASTYQHSSPTMAIAEAYE